MSVICVMAVLLKIMHYMRDEVLCVDSVSHQAIHKKSIQKRGDIIVTSVVIISLHNGSE